MVLVIFLITTCIVVRKTNCYIIGLVHETAVDVHHSLEEPTKWIIAFLENVQEYDPTINFSVHSVSKDSVGNLILPSNVSVDSVIVLAHCETANLLTSYLHEVANFSATVVRFDITPCLHTNQQLDRLEVFRLPSEMQIPCILSSIQQMLNAVKIGQRCLSSSRRSSKVLQNCYGVESSVGNQESSRTNLKILPGTAKEYLRSKNLRVATNQEPPFVYLDRNNKYVGLCFEIMELLSERYNFRFNVTTPADGKYGKRLANGSWNGLIKMILDGEADIAVASLSLTYSRYKAVDLTTYYYEEPTAILIPPPQEEDRLLACTKPFRFEVWFALVLIVGLLPMLMWCQYRVLWNNEGHVSDRSRHPPGLSRQYLFVYGILITQSGQPISKFGNAPRLLAATWCLSCVIFVYLYVSTLKSFLTVPKLQPVINTLEDLPGSKLIWNVVRGAALDSLFSEATEGTYKAIGEELSRHPERYVDSQIQGFYRVTNSSRHVVISEKSSLEWAMERDSKATGKCRLSLAKGEFFKAGQTFALPKGSILLDLFNKEITKMVESGLMDYWHQKHWPRSSKCKHINKGQVAVSMKLTDLQSAFLILIMGYGAAIFTYLLEWLHYELFLPY